MRRYKRRGPYNMAPKPLVDEVQPFKLDKPDRYRTGLLPACLA